MIPDVIDQDELETGERREGSFYSFASFFQKLGTAIALWLMARILDATGYVVPTTATPFPEQPEAAVQALRLFIGLAPAILLTCAVAFALRYPIGRETQRATREAKEAREARDALEAQRAASSGILPG
jgi:GPH family glycoside/pentoside/hexuronide:cation symporter